MDGVSHRQTSAHASRSERTSQAGGIGATVRRQGRAECAEAREQKAGRRSEQLLAVYGVTVPDSIAAGCTAAQLTEAEKGGGAAGQSEEGQDRRSCLSCNILLHTFTQDFNPAVSRVALGASAAYLPPASPFMILAGGPAVGVVDYVGTDGPRRGRRAWDERTDKRCPRIKPWTGVMRQGKAARRAAAVGAYLRARMN